MKIPSKNIINSLQKNQSNTWYSYREHNLIKKKKKNQTLLSIYGHVSNRVWGWKLTRYERNLERIRHTQPDVRQSHSSSHTFECLASTCGQSGAHEGETSLYTQLRAYAACAIRGEPTREHSVGIRVYIYIYDVCVYIYIVHTYIPGSGRASRWRVKVPRGEAGYKEVIEEFEGTTLPVIGRRRILHFWQGCGTRGAAVEVQG